MVSLFSSGPDESTVRRMIRFSDAARDAAQNPDTFGLTPDHIVVLNKVIERLDHQIAKARKYSPRLRRHHRRSTGHSRSGAAAWGMHRETAQRDIQVPERHVENLTAFVPAKDFDLSSRFYTDLGFITVASIKNAVRFERDGYGFWLQNYYVEDWAGNFMICLYVTDLKAWWTHIKGMRVDSAYGAARVLAEPHEQEGGLMMQLADPSGVLWHIRQD